MTGHLQTAGTQDEKHAAQVRCQCQNCGVHGFRDALHYPGGQCHNCGSYALRPLTEARG